MAYAYCENCGEALDKPTPKEILEDDWVCGCGSKSILRYDNVATVILDLTERLEELEARISAHGI